jgi:hypothetical protein
MITTQESGGITYNIRIPQDPPSEVSILKFLGSKISVWVRFRF